MDQREIALLYITHAELQAWEATAETLCWIANRQGMPTLERRMLGDQIAYNKLAASVLRRIKLESKQ